ncbi:MAG TPA: glycosyltransferase family 9 protein, partial [Puia sp.]|nr:glycosyltransferase family 9 protein [Puia sp.]
LLTALSGAGQTIGFDKNPFSRFFTHRVQHTVGGIHEVDRNQMLIRSLTGNETRRPRLYPTAADEEKVHGYKNNPYITISPASVWFTKQYPAEKWIAFIRELPAGYPVYLLGAASDKAMCEEIRGNNPAVVNLSGMLSFLESAGLMKDANMNYVNDSAPMHFASAVNAPVTAVYCSTVPAFGFGPLSDERYIVEIREPLDCRPCGLHGYKACPRGHFHCAWKIEDSQLLQTFINSRPR